MGQYDERSVITRKMAWNDFKNDFTRAEWSTRPLHVWTDIWVNVIRMVFGSSMSRDSSQVAGRVLTFVISLSALLGVCHLLS